MVQLRLLARLRPEATVCSGSDPMLNREMPYIQLTLRCQGCLLDRRTQGYTVRGRILRLIVRVELMKKAEMDVTCLCPSTAISQS
jgi:hypothetical protein